MGVERVVLRAGNGPTPKVKQTVILHIRGMLHSTRKEFWSTMNDGEPFAFVVGVGQVIKGMDEGVLSMKVGEKSELIMTPDYGYGVKGYQAFSIPANASLVFEAELLKIE